MDRNAFIAMCKKKKNEGRVMLCKVKDQPDKGWLKVTTCDPLGCQVKLEDSREYSCDELECKLQ